MTWLLVEDDPDIRNVVAVMMQLWGEKSLALPDGNAAWTWLDSVSAGTFKGELPELALMDIRMPGHTGDQIAARIRETIPLKNIPIILMTAFTLTESEAQSMMARAGVDYLIKKPLPDMEIFRSTLYQIRDAKHKKFTALADIPAAAVTSETASPTGTSGTPKTSPVDPLKTPPLGSSTPPIKTAPPSSAVTPNTSKIGTVPAVPSETPKTPPADNTAVAKTSPTQKSTVSQSAPVVPAETPKTLPTVPTTPTVPTVPITKPINPPPKTHS